MPNLKLLSVAETCWDSDCLACEQSASYDSNKSTVRFSVDLKSQLTIQQFNHGMRQTSSVVLKDFEIDGMLQYLQETKQFLAEQKLVDKLMGRK